MPTDDFKKNRIIYLLIAIMIFMTIILHFSDFVIHRMKTQAFIATMAINYFSFFTLFSNLLFGIAAIILFIKPQALNKNWCRALKISGTSCLIVTGLVYNIVLRASEKALARNFDPTIISMVCNEFFHIITPALAVITWVFVDKQQIFNVKSFLLSTIPPLLYGVYTLVRGSITNFYPYFFLNVTNLGYPKVLMVIALVTLAFSIFAFILGKLERLMKKPAL